MTLLPKAHALLLPEHDSSLSLKNGDSDIAQTLRERTMVFISLEGAGPQAEGQL